jgi:hypothetical protein
MKYLLFLLAASVLALAGIPVALWMLEGDCDPASEVVRARNFYMRW